MHITHTYNNKNNRTSDGRTNISNITDGTHPIYEHDNANTTNGKTNNDNANTTNNNIMCTSYDNIDLIYNNTYINEHNNTIHTLTGIDSDITTNDNNNIENNTKYAILSIATPS